MTIGAPKDADINLSDGQRVLPVSPTAKYRTAIDAGGLRTLDNANITDPNTQITNSTSHIIQRKGKAGTNGKVRVRYPNSAASVPQALILSAWGRSDTQAWERLYNFNGDRFITITPNLTNDSSKTEDDGSVYRFTEVDPKMHQFDTRGCNDVVLGVEQVISLLDGSSAQVGTLASAELAIY